MVGRFGFMKRFGVGWVLLGGMLAASGVCAETFEGSGAGSTEPFHMDGPWTITWGTRTEFPMLAYLEIHLYDARTGRHLGVIAKDAEVEGGEKIIRGGGDYRISTVGHTIDWWVRVEPANRTVAEELKAKPDLREVLILAPDAGVERGVVDHLKSWSAASDRSLTLRTDDGRSLSVSFYGDTSCPGLMSTRNIYFVTSGLRGDIFNAILLEDGTRCFLGGVAPVPVEGTGSSGDGAAARPGRPRDS